MNDDLLQPLVFFTNKRTNSEHCVRPAADRVVTVSTVRKDVLSKAASNGLNQCAGLLVKNSNKGRGGVKTGNRKLRPEA
jgi:hypothetical protein